MIKEPMLCASLMKPSEEHTNANILSAMNKLKYPVLASLKKDGIRAINLGDLASRTLKKIPNESLREWAFHNVCYGFDMELWNPELRYDEIESIVMSNQHSKSDMIQFHILDWWGSKVGHDHYIHRIDSICKWYQSFCESEKGYRRIKFEYPTQCNNSSQLFKFFTEVEQLQGEGICFRSFHSPYKEGRSTLQEQYLVKLSRYERSEVTIIGFEEQTCNINPKQKNFVGKEKPSSAGAGLGKGILGAFKVRDNNGLEFTVGGGPGLTNELRADIWANQEGYLGKQMTIKSKVHGEKVKPRSPQWIGFRKEGY
jgi:hypothetical protein